MCCVVCVGRLSKDTFARCAHKGTAWEGLMGTQNLLWSSAVNLGGIHRSGNARG